MRIPRKDSLTKALGTCRYTDDIVIDGCIYGVPIGAPVSSGKLKKIVFDSRFDWNDFYICTHDDLATFNILPVKNSDEPILVDREIRYYGQPVVLLAHDDKEKLEEAKGHVLFEVSELPPILSAGVGDHIVQDRVFAEKVINKGDLDKALSEADVVMSSEFSTQAQEHLYLETQIVVSRFDSVTKTINIQGAMQAPYNVMEVVKRLFKNVADEVIVTPNVMGGAFGGREDFTSQLALQASLLAVKSGRPVKLKLSREYDLKYSTKRHPSSSRVRLAVKNGKITALDLDFLLDAGAYETISGIVLNRSMLHAGCYDIPNSRIHGRAVMTNTPPNGAFRGFGAPQVFFPVESAVDQIVREYKYNEVDFRRNNLVTKESIGGSGQKLFDDLGTDEMFSRLVELSHYEDLRKQVAEFNSSNKIKRQGLGFSTVIHGTGYTGYQDIDGSVSLNLRLKASGNVEIESSVTEMGQGSWTVLPQIAADILMIPISRVSVRNVNTKETPSSGPTVASRTVSVLGELVRRAALKLKDRMSKTQSIGEEEEVLITETHVHVEGEYFDYETLQGYAYQDYSSAALLVLLEVDLLTCDVHVKKVYMTIDAGKIVNLSNAEAQVQGGVVQGLGYALYEQMKIGDKGYQNESVSNYPVPTAVDTPDFEIYFLGGEKSRSKGLGEIPLTGVAPAVTNALEDAIKIRFCDLPVCPEKISAAFNCKEKIGDC